MSSRKARATQRNPILKNQKRKEGRKEAFVNIFKGCILSVFILCVLFLHIQSLSPISSFLTFTTLILISALDMCLLVVNVEVFVWSVRRENMTLYAVVL